MVGFTHLTSICLVSLFIYVHFFGGGIFLSFFFRLFFRSPAPDNQKINPKTGGVDSGVSGKQTD